jgi:hypothetical protein
MVEGAELSYFAVRLENGRFSDLTYCKKPRNKFCGEREPTSCAVKVEEICR